MRKRLNSPRFAEYPQHTIVPNPLNFKIADGFRNAERPSQCSGGSCRCCGGMVGVDVGGVACLPGSRLEVR